MLDSEVSANFILANTALIMVSVLFRNNIIAVGCSNGIVQLANSSSARLIGTYSETNSTSGVVHIEVRLNRRLLQDDKACV